MVVVAAPSGCHCLSVVNARERGNTRGCVVRVSSLPNSVVLIPNLAATAAQRSASLYSCRVSLLVVFRHRPVLVGSGTAARPRRRCCRRSHGGCLAGSCRR